MDSNLIPSFVMRGARLAVKDVPKIHVNYPDVNDHAILCQETGFRIPLSLWGVFSYFPSAKPTLVEAEGGEDIYLLTPTRQNPHCNSYT
eukprot:15340972-Ditylum_brightwellii.AAC.1